MAENAFDELVNLLNEAGLGSLTDWVREQLIAGKSDIEVQIELERTEAFQARFPGIKAARDNGIRPLTPGEYIEYETSAAEAARRYGLDEGFYKRGTGFDQLVAQAMGNGVSARQYVERIDQGFARVARAPEEVRAGFHRLFGVHGDAALASLYLNPERPQEDLERMAAAAEAAGTGERFGLNLSAERSMELAGYDLTLDEVRRGFGEISRDRQLYEERSFEHDISAEQEGVGEAFALDEESAEALRERRQDRTATTAGAGGAAETRQGYGLGSAR